MIDSRSLRLGFLAMVACAAAYGDSRVAVTSVRTWPMGDITRVAIELTGRPEWRAELIENPDRLFFDISDSRIAFEKGAPRSPDPADPLVRQIRVGMNQRTVARVVLELTGKVEYEASVLSNPWRLMVELRPAGSRPAVTERKPVETPSPAPQPPAPVSAAAKPIVKEPDAVTRTAATTAAPPVAPPATQKVDTGDADKAAAIVLVKPPKPAKVNQVTGQRSLTRALGLKLGRIVLDPGHGGSDYGTSGSGGLHEKDLVLDVAKKLGDLITERLGAEVVFTRTDDTFIPLQERTAIANRAEADLFLSIHANSSPSRSVAGPETFYLSLTTSKAELEVAARENAANGQSIFELESLLKKIAKQDKAEESGEFASRVQRTLYAESRRRNRDAKNRGVKKAPFVVLVGARMPSVLAEIGFLSNRREEALLKQADYRQQVAEALYKGVEQYASTLSQMEVAQVGESGQ